MSFTAKDVANLRGMTGAGMMDCKKALVETNGDIDEAVAFLRKKGIASAAKKAGNVAAEGLLAGRVSEDGKFGVIVEVNSQTDFVAKNDNFVNFVNQVADIALANKTTNIQDLLNADCNGKKLEEAAVEQTAKTGEKVDVRRVSAVEVTEGTVGLYVHPVGSKIASLIALGGADTTADKAVDLAMHIAASAPAPEFKTRNEIPAETIEAEKKIESQKEDLAGKPAEIVEKIVTGRVDKLLASKVLVEQAFIKDPNQKVSQYLGSAEVTDFVRMNLGEGIEKKEDNFADEVAAMTAN